LQSQQNCPAITIDKLEDEFAKLQQEVCLYRQPTSATIVSDFVGRSLPTSKARKKQLLAVLHADFEDSKRLQFKHSIASGLAAKPGVSDVDRFLDKCQHNLTLELYVVRAKCRRL
jgi:hypothetical protein